LLLGPDPPSKFVAATVTMLPPIGRLTLTVKIFPLLALVVSCAILSCFRDDMKETMIDRNRVNKKNQDSDHYGCAACEQKNPLGLFEMTKFTFEPHTIATNDEWIVVRSTESQKNIRTTHFGKCGVNLAPANISSHDTIPRKNISSMNAITETLFPAFHSGDHALSRNLKKIVKAVRYISLRRFNIRTLVREQINH
jgi:hypothetical protein